MKKRSIYLIVFSVLLIYYLLVTIFDISMPCLIHKFTGLYCVTCGISRMFISIIHFDFYQAFRYNPFCFLILLLFVISLLINNIFSKFLSFKIKYNKYILLSILFLGITFMVLRNIKYFSYLQPTIIK